MVTDTSTAMYEVDRDNGDAIDALRESRGGGSSLCFVNGVAMGAGSALEAIGALKGYAPGAMTAAAKRVKVPRESQTISRAEVKAVMAPFVSGEKDILKTEVAAPRVVAAVVDNRTAAEVKQDAAEAADMGRKLRKAARSEDKAARVLKVNLNGKLAPVESLEAAAVAFQWWIKSNDFGVSNLKRYAGNVTSVDTGKMVGHISYNGRSWESDKDGAKELPSEAARAVGDRSPKPDACPKCTGTDCELIETVVLGWECAGCRKVRRDNHGGEAAVAARRASIEHARASEAQNAADFAAVAAAAAAVGRNTKRAKLPELVPTGVKSDGTRTYAIKGTEHMEAVTGEPRKGPKNAAAALLAVPSIAAKVEKIEAARVSAAIVTGVVVPSLAIELPFAFTMTAAGTDATRGALCDRIGGDGKGVIVGTDGHRLHLAKLPAGVAALCPERSMLSTPRRSSTRSTRAR